LGLISQSDLQGKDVISEKVANISQLNQPWMYQDKAKGKLKQDEKKEKGKLKVALPMQIVVATTASSSNDPQGLTIHGTSSNPTEPLSPSK
jgi:hypothetical protein